MPCDASHCAANELEIETSRMACLIDEMNGRAINKDWWKGYHPRAYCRSSQEMADSMTEYLCSRLQSINVKLYSLEMQMWWRDHQAADKAKAEAEIAKARDDNDRKIALSKLTLREMKLLGLSKEVK